MSEVKRFRVPTTDVDVVLASDYTALQAELASAKASALLVEERIRTLEAALQGIKFNAGNKTGYGLIWQIAELALGSEHDRRKAFQAALAPTATEGEK